jgi:hypothetical protein
MTKKIKVYRKINLYETSVVGIPAYPDAHMDTSCSLVKSLSAYDLIKFKGDSQMSEEKTQEALEISKEAIVEKAVEKKVDIGLEIAKAIKDGLKDAIAEMETKRGLVADEKATTPVKKSIGELTLEMFRRDIER